DPVTILDLREERLEADRTDPPQETGQADRRGQEEASAVEARARQHDAAAAPAPGLHAPAPGPHAIPLPHDPGLAVPYTHAISAPVQRRLHRQSGVRHRAPPEGKRRAAVILDRARARPVRLIVVPDPGQDIAGAVREDGAGHPGDAVPE